MTHPIPDRQAVKLRPPGPVALAGRALRVTATLLRRLGPQLVAHALGRGDSARLTTALRITCDDLGATYIKFGQIIASAPTLTGEETAAQFRSMLDAGPPVPFPDVVREIERTSGKPVRKTFSRLDPEPIGQASLAVVHRGTLIDGRDVAVKVLRPGIEKVLASDLVLLRAAVRALGVAVPAVGELATGLVDDLAGQLQHEVDLRIEAAIMQHFRGLPQHDDLPLVVVPEPLVQLSGRRVLVMDFLDGVPIDDANLDALGVDASALVDQVVKAWLLTALRDGIFHGDVHAGNILFLRDGRAGLIDWGITGQLDPDAHWMLRRFIGGAIGDESAWDDLADHLSSHLSTVQPDLRPDRDMLRMVLRDHLSAVVNKPFGEFSLSEVILSLNTQSSVIRGIAAQPRRTQRTTRKMVDAIRRTRQPAPDLTLMGGGMLLLAKQLAYFERYGKLHLGELAVLHDTEFFRDVLKT